MGKFCKNVLRQETIDKFIKIVEDRFNQKWQITKILTVIIVVYVLGLLVLNFNTLMEYGQNIKGQGMREVDLGDLLLPAFMMLVIFYLTIKKNEEVLRKEEARKEIILKVELIDVKNQNLITEEEYNDLYNFLTKYNLLDKNIEYFLNYCKQQKNSILEQIKNNK